MRPKKQQQQKQLAALLPLSFRPENKLESDVQQVSLPPVCVLYL